MPTSQLHRRRATTTAVSLAALLPILSANAADSEFRVFGSMALQEKSLTFTLADIPIDSSQTTYNFSVGVARSGFYLLAEAERPFSQDIQVIPDPSTPRQATIEREDSALTAGYNVWRSLNVFVGRKTGKTSIQIMPSGASSEALEFRYKEKGNFVGASYAVDFESRGQLSLSVAYADMPTTLTMTSLRTQAEESTTGKTTGTSIGAKWTGVLSPGLDYSVGYKQSNYRFNDETQVINSSDYDTKQTYKTFFVGLSKIF